MTERKTFDLEVYEGGRWILTGSYQTASRAIAAAKEEGGARQARVRADRWDEAAQLYVGNIVFEYEPPSAGSYRGRYLKK